jgi:hypothetical protein
LKQDSSADHRDLSSLSVQLSQKAAGTTRRSIADGKSRLRKCYHCDAAIRVSGSHLLFAAFRALILPPRTSKHQIIAGKARTQQFAGN